MSQLLSKIISHQYMMAKYHSKISLRQKALLYHSYILL